MESSICDRAMSFLLVYLLSEWAQSSLNISKKLLTKKSYMYLFIENMLKSKTWQGKQGGKSLFLVLHINVWSHISDIFNYYEKSKYAWLLPLCTQKRCKNLAVILHYRVSFLRPLRSLRNDNYLNSFRGRGSGAPKHPVLAKRKHFNACKDLFLLWIFVYHKLSIITYTSHFSNVSKMINFEYFASFAIFTVGESSFPIQKSQLRHTRFLIEYCFYTT